MCLAIYAFAFALIVVVGVGAWFLMRAWWRSLAVNKPDSRIVAFGSKMTSMGRKVLAGVISAVVVLALCAGVSSCSSANKTKDTGTETTATATKSEDKADDEEKSDDSAKATGSKTVNTMTQSSSKSTKERVEDFISAFNAASGSTFVQDTTFDPSDGDAPYRPHRYTSPVYKGGSGAHGTCGDFSVTVIGSQIGTEVKAVIGDYDYQAVADFARAAILAMKPDVDQSALDAALDKFVNEDLHTLDFGSIDNDLLQGSATDREFFLRVD